MIPCDDECQGDLFDIVFSDPKNNQAKGTGKSAAIATFSVPTKETQGGLNLTDDDASGSKENADGSLALSPSDQILIQKAEAFLMSDDIAIDDEDAADFSFPIL